MKFAITSGIYFASGVALDASEEMRAEFFKVKDSPLSKLPDTGRK